MKRALLLLLLLAACSDRKEELYLFCWSDFFAEEVLQQFEEDFNCRIILDTYDSNEAMYAKIRAGGSGYDLIFPSLYFHQILEEQDLLAPITSSLIPNLSNLDWDLLEAMGISSSKNYVPYMVTYTALGYRKDRVETPSSWTIFDDQELRGRMTMLNDIREAFGAALIILGYSVNTTDPEEIDEAKELLISWKSNLAKFESEQYKNGIASAEYLVVQGYSSDLLQVMAESPEVLLSVPVEGTIITCDTACLLKNSRPKKLAHHFINYLLRASVALKNMEKTKGLCPNTRAIPKLTETQKKLLILNEEQQRLSQKIQEIGKARSLYIEAWDRVKESSN